MIAKGKRILSWMLAVCLIVLLVPATVLAETMDGVWAENGKPTDVAVSIENGSGGSKPWVAAQNIGGRSCYSSNCAATKNGTSKFSMSFTVPEGQTMYLVFDYTVSSEATYDRFMVFDTPIDLTNRSDVSRARVAVSGTDYGTTASNIQWQSAQLAVDEGEQFITFAYCKDSSGDKGLDAAYVSNVRLQSEPLLGDGSVTVDFDSSVGSVYLDGKEITSGEANSVLAYNTEFTVRAVPNTGYYFKQWQVLGESGSYEDLSGDNPCTLELGSSDETCQLKAVFEKQTSVYISVAYDSAFGTVQYREEFAAASDWHTIVSGEKTQVNSNQKLNLRIQPAEGQDIYNGGLYYFDDSNKKVEIIKAGATEGVLTLGTSGVMMAAELKSKAFADIGGLTTPGITSVQTRGHFPWTNSFGVLQSGAKGIGNGISTLKLELSGPGMLVFEYFTSSEKNYDKLYLVTGPEPTDASALKSAGGDENDKTVTVIGMGEVDWTSYMLGFDKAEGETFTVYLVYAKDSSGDKGEDCARIRNLAYVSGSATVKATSAAPEFGTVTLTEKTENDIYACGTVLTATATPATGYQFYGWMNKTTGQLVSTDAAYSFTVTADAEIEAVFAAAGQFAAQTETGFYDDLATAINSTNLGTIRVLKDCAVTQDATVAPGVTMLIPFSDSDRTGLALGTAAVARPSIATSAPTRTVTVSSGASLNVSGTLIVGAVQHATDQNAQGQTSGAYTKLAVEGNLVVNNGGFLDVNGLVSGSGSTKLLKGGEMAIPFLVTDYAGGTNTENLYNNGTFPFGQFCTMNVQTPFYMEGGAKLVGSTSLYFYSSITTQDVDLVATNSGLIYLPEGSTLTATYNANQAIKSAVGNINLTDFGKTSITISGGATGGQFFLQSYGSGDKYLHIPYTYDITLTNGTYTMDKFYRVMPGANLNVAADATLNVTGGLQAVDGWQAADKSGKSYPSSTLLSTNGFAKNGNLTVNGTLNIADGATFGGIVSATAAGGKVITGNGSQLAKTDFFGGSTGGYTDNYCTYALPARINVNGTLHQLLENSQYESKSADAWTLEAFTMTANRVTGDTVTIKQAMKGNWGDPATVTFDANGGALTEGEQTAYDLIPGSTLEAIPTDPTWGYNSFKGWFTAQEGGEAYVPGTTVINEAMTVYAQWDMHVHDNNDVVTAPTCTEQGFTTHTCKVCGEVTVDSYVDALGHDWIPATTTAPKTCARCELTEGDPLDSAPITVKSQYSSDDQTAAAERFTAEYTDQLRTIRVTKNEAGKGYVFVIRATVNGETVPVSANADGTYTLPEGTTAVDVVSALRGDINLDGKLNTRDAALVARIAASLQDMPAGDADLRTALIDANGDGKLNTRDAALVARAAAGLHSFD